MKKNLKAMTLLELVIVIIILGIFASLGLVQFKKIILQTREQTAVVNLNAIAAANQIYRARFGHFWDTSGAVMQDLDINQNLNLGIIAEGMQYSYQSNGATFIATAEWDISGADYFSLSVDETPLSGRNPCCQNGACPRQPAC